VESGTDLRKTEKREGGRTAGSVKVPIAGEYKGRRLGGESRKGIVKPERITLLNSPGGEKGLPRGNMAFERECSLGKRKKERVRGEGFTIREKS